MTIEDETRRVVEGYFVAWTTNKVSDAYAFRATDLEFIGPTATYRSAELFHPALVGVAAMTKSARIIVLLKSLAR